MKKLSILSLILVFVSVHAWAGTFTTQNTMIPVPAQATATEAGDTSAASSNNIQLDARVYIPDGVTSSAPAIVIIHGYGGSKIDGPVVALANDFATNGYVVVTPTTRGFGDSDGLVTLAGPNEVNDLKTIILAMQTGIIGDVTIPVSSNSLFGVTGASYGGGHSFEIMRTHVAGLAAVAPIIGWTDLYQALAPNDVPKFSFTLGLFGGGFNPQNANYDQQMFDWLDALLSRHPERTRTGGPEANIDWRSVIFDPVELTVPAFVIQGWRDWLFPVEQATSLFQTNSAIPFFKLYLGGLGHPPAEADINNPEALFLRAQLLRWFDQWLKGVDTGITSEPRVTVGPEKTEDWSEAGLLTADTFPLPGTTTNTYFLNEFTLSTNNAAGKPISVQRTGKAPSFLRPLENLFGGNFDNLIAAVVSLNVVVNEGAGIFDPRIVTGLDSEAKARLFTGPVLAEDVHVVGLPEFHLFVSSGKSNAIYFVEIIERTENTARLVTRGAFKDHNVSPQTPHEIIFSPFSANHVFAAGSQIRLRIASRDFPFFLPNPRQPRVKIYRDATNPSSVMLPVVP